MNYIEFIKENLQKVTHGARRDYVKVHISPDIKDKVLSNINKATKGKMSSDACIGIIDTSLAGSGKEGIYFSSEKIVIKEMMESPVELFFNDIAEVKTDIRIHKEKELNYNIIEFKDGSTYSISDILSNHINAKSFEEFVNHIIESNEENEFIEQKQIVPLEELDIDIKKIYVKLLCNYAYSDDNVIDSKEYAELITFIVKINMDEDSRLELRSYMSDISKMEDTYELMKQLNGLCIDVDFTVVKLSLFSDLIDLYALEINQDETLNDSFILDLANKYDVDTKKLEMFLDNNRRNKDILEQRLNDNDIKKTMKDISSKAASVGVPMAALYLSGTAGVSAVGMTTGLSALGMGGILGFSSMFTGVGVLALLGITSYQGMKKLTGLNDEKNNKQREIMLQEIIRNNQESLQYLIEDVNIISSRLIDEIKKGHQNSIQIEKLSKMLKSISRGSMEVVNKLEHYESESILTKAPLELKIDKILELSKGDEKVENIIFDLYDENDGNLTLKNNISSKNAFELVASLEKIGYFNLSNNATATVKSSSKNIFSAIRR